MRFTHSILAILVSAVFIHSVSAAPPASTIQIEIPAMKCSGCSWAVTEALKKLDGVSAIHVDWKSKIALAEVESLESPGEKNLFAAIEKAGHKPTTYRSLDVTFSEAKKKIVRQE